MKTISDLTLGIFLLSCMVSVAEAEKLEKEIEKMCATETKKETHENI